MCNISLLFNTHQMPYKEEFSCALGRQMCNAQKSKGKKEMSGRGAAVFD